MTGTQETAKGVLAYVSEKALRPASVRPHHGNGDGTCKRLG